MTVVVSNGSEDKAMSQSRLDSELIFQPIEDAIFSQWLGIEPPPDAENISLYRVLDDPEAEPGGTATLVQLNLSNAVAKLLLQGVQNRLPQWAATYEDHIELSRDYTDKTPRKVEFMPQLLFEINWADSGPGFSWPEMYMVTYVPVYDVYIVTASADSPDRWGFCDRAIGWFPPQTSIKDGAHGIVTAGWRYQYRECNQHPWVELLANGLISDADAEAWSEEVWGDYQW